MNFGKNSSMRRAERSFSTTVGTIIVVGIVSGIVTLGIVGVVIWAIIKLVLWLTN